MQEQGSHPAATEGGDETQKENQLLRYSKDGLGRGVGEQGMLEDKLR